MITIGMIVLGVVNYIVTQIVKNMKLPDIQMTTGTIIKAGLYVSALIACIVGCGLYLLQSHYPEFYANIKEIMAGSFLIAQTIYATINAIQPKDK